MTTPSFPPGKFFDLHTVKERTVLYVLQLDRIDPEIDIQNPQYLGNMYYRLY